MVRKYIALCVGALVFSTGLFVGCSDSASVAPDDHSSAVSTDDAFNKLLVSVDPIATEIDDAIIGLDAAPEVNFKESPDGPHNGGHEGRDPGDTAKRPHPDSLKRPHPDSLKRPMPDSLKRPGGEGPGPRPTPAEQRFKRILGQLDLTADQQIQIKTCFDAYRECIKPATERYRAALMELRNQLNAAKRDLKAQVDAGQITIEEARAQFKTLAEQFRTDATALADAYKQAIADCEQALIDCIKSYLTTEQAAKWDELIARMGAGRKG